MSRNQNIKKDRIISYFIEAAKEIIMGAGTDGISVRKVAEKAGYSYATIYNYYKNLHELLWDVKKSFVVELQEYLIQNTIEATSEKDIKTMLHAYVSYFVEYPNVFRFFYMYPLDNEIGDLEELFSIFGSISLKTSSDFASAQLANADIISKTCVYTVHGMLMLFFSSNGMTKELLFYDLTKILDFLFTVEGRG